MAPVNARLLAPTVAETKQLIAARVMNMTTCLTSFGMRGPITRRYRNAARNACSVDPTAMLPAAMAAVVDSILSVRKKSTLTRNDPNQIPAPARDPRRSVAVSAIPEGGHITVTLPGGIATKNPSWAVAIYTIAIASASAKRLLISPRE
jgi:hypothetical protein